MTYRALVFAGIVLVIALGVALWPAPAPKSPTLIRLGTYSTGEFQKSAAEIVAHDPTTQRLFVVNALNAAVDVLDISNPARPAKIREIDLAPYGGVANSVAARDGALAVAVESFQKTDPGAVVLFDRALTALSSVRVGSQPDMLIFSPDGRWLLVANEGEPSSYHDDDGEKSIDPEGSVSVIDLSKGAAHLTQADVRTASFTAFNEGPLDPRIRILGPNATVAQDLEPEYIAISPDSRTAWVTLQENNAIARIDIASAKVTRLVGLGLKNHSQAANGLDASDRDDATGTGPAIHIRPWPVRGMYQPDSIAAYDVGGATYLVTANEGDAREWPGFAEEITMRSGSSVRAPSRSGRQKEPSSRIAAKSSRRSPQRSTPRTSMPPTAAMLWIPAVQVKARNPRGSRWVRPMDVRGRSLAWSKSEASRSTTSQIPRDRSSPAM
jgi:hypothetical protein